MRTSAAVIRIILRKYILKAAPTLRISISVFDILVAQYYYNLNLCWATGYVKRWTVIMTTAFVTRSLRCTEQQRTKVAALWNFTSNSSKAVNTCFATSYNDRRWNSRQPSSQKPIERSFDKISLFRDFSLTTGSWKQKSNSPQATASEDDLLPPKNLGIIARFKAMYKQYWYVMVPVHVITSTGWLVGFYYLSKR